MRGLILDASDLQRRTRTRIVRDPATGVPLIISQQDVRDVVRDAQRMASHYDPHIHGRRHMRQVAEIPVVIWNRLHKLGITRDRKALLKWLSRRDARFFRTDGGGRLA